MKSMKFRVATFFYTVLITDELLFDESGAAAVALAEKTGRRIRISSELPREERVTTLLHELWHAWQFHMPRCRSEEEEADAMAMVSQAAWDDLEQQGGAAALRRLGDPEEPKPVPSPSGRDAWSFDEAITSVAVDEGPRYVPADELQRFDFKGQASGGRAECGHCSCTVSDGMIVTGRARFEDKAVGWVVSREMYCPHCGHVQGWTEGCDPNGLPNGSPLGTPSYLRGEYVEKFLIEHPEAAGLAVG